jgi:hypothetical protein
VLVAAGAVDLVLVLEEQAVRHAPTPTASPMPTTRTSSARAALRTHSWRRSTASTSMRFPTSCGISPSSASGIRPRRPRSSPAARGRRSRRRAPTGGSGVCRSFHRPETASLSVASLLARQQPGSHTGCGGSCSSGGGFRPRPLPSLERVRDREGRPRSFPVRPPSPRDGMRESPDSAASDAVRLDCRSPGERQKG